VIFHVVSPAKIENKYFPLLAQGFNGCIVEETESGGRMVRVDTVVTLELEVNRQDYTLNAISSQG